MGVLTALAGYNQLAYGDASGALESFQRVVEAHPEELLGWEGLRTAAEVVGDRGTLAEACAALGDAVSDASEGSEFWEKAALILLDEFKDQTRGEFALSRAVERDVHRFTAFDRLFRMVRERKDGPRLLELVARRLEVAEDPSRDRQAVLGASARAARSGRSRGRAQRARERALAGTRARRCAGAFGRSVHHARSLCGGRRKSGATGRHWTKHRRSNA